MTVCLYLAIDGFPTIISDISVSEVGQSDVLTPGNLGFKLPSPRSKVADLYSKTLLLHNPPAVLSFAGEEAAIVELSQSLPSYYQHMQDERRPMRLVGDLANDFNWEHNREVVSVLGCSQYETKEFLRTNILDGARRLVIPTTHFGKCLAIGSGAEAIAEYLVTYDYGFPSQFDHEPNPFEKVMGVVGYLNSIQLFGRDQEGTHSTWGGFLEANTILPNGEIHQPGSWTQLAHYYDVTDGKMVIRSSKQVHYNLLD